MRLLCRHNVNLQLRATVPTKSQALLLPFVHIHQGKHSSPQQSALANVHIDQVLVHCKSNLQSRASLLSMLLTAFRSVPTQSQWGPLVQVCSHLMIARLPLARDPIDCAFAFFRRFLSSGTHPVQAVMEGVGMGKASSGT
jgi:hypothetical protein